MFIIYLLVYFVCICALWIKVVIFFFFPWESNAVPFGLVSLYCKLIKSIMIYSLYLVFIMKTFSKFKKKRKKRQSGSINQCLPQSTFGITFQLNVHCIFTNKHSWLCNICQVLNRYWRSSQELKKLSNFIPLNNLTGHIQTLPEQRLISSIKFKIPSYFLPLYTQNTL